MKRRKYGNRKVTIDNIKFDSAREAVRYRKLGLLQAAGLISDLELQKRFLLVPAQKRSDGKAERAVHYVADFVYQQDGNVIVEDSKGVKTPDYIIKRKLMLERHGITVIEV
jgi:hypothetical protein